MKIIKEVKQRLKTKIGDKELALELSLEHGCTLKKAREYIKVAKNG